MLQLVQGTLSVTNDSYIFYILNGIPEYSVLWPLVPFELHFVTGEQEQDTSPYGLTGILIMPFFFVLYLFPIFVINATP